MDPELSGLAKPRYDGGSFISSAANAMLITVGWAALAAVFSFSIAMVVWGRNGDNVLPF